MEREKITTFGDYELFEVASAIQKCIRRGYEDQAMYWAVELYDAGYDKYLWRRLIIMSTEDVGLATPNAPVIITALSQQYWMLKEKENDHKMQWRLPLTQAILYLCRVEKSRETDWALNYYWDGHYIDERQEIPDFAFDIHTKRGKAMGRTIEYFIDEGAKVHPHKETDREAYFRETCRGWWTDQDILNKIKQWKNWVKDRKSARYNRGPMPNKPTDTQTSMF